MFRGGAFGRGVGAEHANLHALLRDGLQCDDSRAEEAENNVTSFFRALIAADEEFHNAQTTTDTAAKDAA